MKTKKLLLVFVLVGISAININAQMQPTNAGFENWVNIGPAENPLDWSSFNNFYNYQVPALSFKTTDKHSGTYALKVVSDTATVPPPFGTNTLDTLTGYVFLGGPDMSNPGITYTDRPVLMQAFVKGTILSGGNAMIIATLRKYNTVTNVRDEVGKAMYFTNTSIANYTAVSVPFNYSLTSIPDTLVIEVMAGNGGPGAFIMPGNEFFVDDISFTFPVGINEMSMDQLTVNIFPNPTSDKVTIASSEKINAIEIYNILGEKMYSMKNFKQQTSYEIDLRSFQKGIYFIRINDGEKNRTEKIIVQ